MINRTERMPGSEGPARPRRSRFAAKAFACAALAVAVGSNWPARGEGQEPPPAKPSLASELDTLHKQAKDARGKKDFGEVERLRIQRRQVIMASEEKSIWKSGMDAMEKASRALGRMQYREAAQLLRTAWEPFAKSPSHQPVLGDLAMDIFFANEAARMIDPASSIVPHDVLVECLKRASATDPCHVECGDALAFLVPPNPSESFRTLENREFVRLRNERLLAIDRDRSSESPVLPWHAPVSYLLGKSSSFAIRDSDYLRTFLDPSVRLQGVNRHGATWCLVLGGGILVSSIERQSGEVRTVIKIDSYDSDRKVWQALYPQIVLVSAPQGGGNEKEWKDLVMADVEARLDKALVSLEGKIKKDAEGQLFAIAARFPPEVAGAVRQILDGTWKNGPPPGSPIDLKFNQASIEFANYAGFLESRSKPREAEKARAATAEIDALRAKLVLRKQPLCAPVIAPVGDQRPLNDGLKVYLDPTKRPPGGPAFPSDLMTQLGELRTLAEGIDFAAAGAPPPKAESALEIAGFGDAPSPEANAPDGSFDANFKEELLSAVTGAELLVACQFFDEPKFKGRYEQQGTLFQHIDAAVEDYKLACNNVLPKDGPVPQLTEATERLRTLLNQEKKTIGTFAAIRHQLLRLLVASGELQLQDSKSVSAIHESVRRYLDVDARIIRAIDGRRRLRAMVAGKKPVRTWKVPNARWEFFELSGILPEDASEVVEAVPPLLVASSDLDKVDSHLAGGGTTPPPPTLQAGSVPLGQRLASVRGSIPTLDLQTKPPPWGLVGLVLVDRDIGPPSLGPHAILNEKGAATLLLDDRGTQRPAVIDLGANELVVEYPGLEGHIRLGVEPKAEADSRYLKDQTGQRITPSQNDPGRLFDIVAANGARIDSAYYSIKGLVDVDRNIVNEFFPRAAFYCPCLPSWQAYREQLVRQSPAVSVRWAVPRRAYWSYWQDDVAPK